MGKQYGILAGSQSRPEFILVGTLEKGSGSTITTGEPVKVMAKRGDVGVPNYTEAWAVRLDKEGKVPEPAITDVRDVRYGGQVKEMEWGSAGGTLIPCRFLKGFGSIDVLYQDLVMNAKASIQDDSDIHYLVFQTGDNYYDVEADRYLVQMLRVHCLNSSSKSKSPEYSSGWFRELSEETTVTQLTKTIDTKFEALKIVNEAAQDNSNAKLKNLYAIFDGVADETIKENDLFRYFSLMADEEPVKFMNRIGEYKREVSEAMSMATSFQMMDLTKDGFIVIGEKEKKKDIIAEGVPGKKEKMLDWVMENFMDVKAFKVAFTLKQYTEKIK